MPCDPVKLPDGTAAIVCSRKPRRRCSNGRRGNVSAGQCFRRATKLCDFPLPSGKTCDKPLCDVCAVNVGPDRDYCPEHARAQGSRSLCFDPAPLLHRPVLPDRK